MSNTQNNTTIQALQRGVGSIAIALPLILLIGPYLHQNVFSQPSLSHYYYLPMLGDIMVGCMAAVAGFLVCYRGYCQRDRWITTGGGIALLCVALFATSNEPGQPAEGFTRALIDVPANCNCTEETIKLTGVTFEILDAFVVLHALAAFVFFLSLAWMCFMEFTRTDKPNNMGAAKLFRNKIYRICGWLIVVPTALLALRYLFFADWQPWDDAQVTFWLEAIAIWAFGFAWITKGDMIRPDP